MQIRTATARDGAACAAIYAPYVTDSVISFEYRPPDANEMARRITEANRAHAWLVAERDGAVAGYAYGGTWKARDAYRFTCEVSIYLGSAPRRTGTGRMLYTALLDALGGLGYRRAVAGIALPNDASVGLHRALGFETVGTYREIGWKNDAWHDVMWTQRALGPAPDTGPAPGPASGP